jgi:hypothetical protein
MRFLKRTCREVAAILVAREDRALGLADRIALRLHMTVCDACPKFERQMLTMRNCMAQWRNYAATDDRSDQ